MHAIEGNIKWIMLVVGLITCSTLLVVISPQAGLMSMFGALPSALDEGVTQILVRNWGALIALVGGMLIYAAFRPALRSFSIVVACISKATFISLVLGFGGDYWDQALFAIVFDSAAIVIFLMYLFSTDSNQS
ncbi:hypothetical protein [Arenicella xantha]|uniref:DUF4345 domain-containing protein n=1 Tax=Arenicella xantha TaxID=644221 RepID=A0A395JNF7_9GAMM|nr:hypothetical protein [Arenicella xantha]RBP52833.1 hypothetical protein DFR28_101217 [Arenicella xantha]